MGDVVWERLVYLDANGFIDAYDGEEALSGPREIIARTSPDAPGGSGN